MIRNVAAHELKPMLGRDDIHVHLHATSSKKDPSSMDSGVNTDQVVGEEPKITPSSSIIDGIHISPCRPNIRETILSVIDGANISGSVERRIAVLVCGPPGMADEAKAAVHTG